MTDVQVPVRFRRETGPDGLVLALGQVFVDDLANKIGACCIGHLG
jgi:hypothetical protein